MPKLVELVKSENKIEIRSLAYLCVL